MSRPRKSEAPARPDDDVKYVCTLKRSERARLRMIALAQGVDSDALGAKWILDRLAQEERRLAK